MLVSESNVPWLGIVKKTGKAFDGKTTGCLFNWTCTGRYSPRVPKIACLKNIISTELVLDTDVPVVGCRAFLIWNEAGGSISGIHTLGNGNRGVWKDASAGKEAGRIQAGYIHRSAQLRRQAQRTEVIVKDVISEAEPRTDRRSAAISRRIGDAHSRHKVRRLCFWLIEHKQTRDTRARIQDLRILAHRNGQVFVTQSQIDR